MFKASYTKWMKFKFTRVERSASVTGTMKYPREEFRRLIGKNLVLHPFDVYTDAVDLQQTEMSISRYLAEAYFP